MTSDTLAKVRRRIRKWLHLRRSDETTTKNEQRHSVDREAMSPVQGTYGALEAESGTQRDRQSIITESKRESLRKRSRYLTAFRQSLIFTSRSADTSENPPQHRSRLSLTETRHSPGATHRANSIDNLPHNQTTQVLNYRNYNTTLAAHGDDRTVLQNPIPVVSATLIESDGNTVQNLEAEVSSDEVSSISSSDSSKPESISSTSLSSGAKILKTLNLEVKKPRGSRRCYFRAKMDIGADFNLMTEDIADRIGRNRIDFKQTRAFFTTANVLYETIGRLEVIFRWNGHAKWYKAGFYVLARKDMSYRFDSLLSRNFIEKVRLLIEGPALRDEAPAVVHEPLAQVHRSE